MDLVRYAYNAVGFGAGRCMEFCAGPGFIGFALLASGVCNSLLLADINPEAMLAVQATLSHPSNAHLRGRVSVHQSDVWDGIPDAELASIDLVFSNPPHYNAEFSGEGADLRAYDPDWSIHRRFYHGAAKYLTAKGRIIMQEQGERSQLSDFTAMIQEGGLRVIAAESAQHPIPRRFYYIVSVPRDQPFGLFGHHAPEIPMQQVVWIPCEDVMREEVHPAAAHYFHGIASVEVDGVLDNFEYGCNATAQLCDLADLRTAARQFLAKDGILDDSHGSTTAELVDVMLSRIRAWSSVPRQQDLEAPSIVNACEGLFARPSHEMPFSKRPEKTSWASPGAADWCLAFDPHFLKRMSSIFGLYRPEFTEFTPPFNRCFPQAPLVHSYGHVVVGSGRGEPKAHHLFPLCTHAMQHETMCRRLTII
eukprot:TRINITY_DN72436_c0_g1_i1.p1 TRINITY_DN72436_c0_g1~~TRINITY_DN72436_c0_g1_i1.p1  ORF type:complete len:462 (+),score=59.45 TRINITY_DN72436_c0_g1_i1:129-1388(+)